MQDTYTAQFHTLEGIATESYVLVDKRTPEGKLTETIQPRSIEGLDGADPTDLANIEHRANKQLAREGFIIAGDWVRMEPEYPYYAPHDFEQDDPRYMHKFTAPVTLDSSAPPFAG